MKHYELICSIDAVDIDYSETITAETAADFWACHWIADEHGCSFWYVNEWTE